MNRPRTRGWIAATCALLLAAILLTRRDARDPPGREAEPAAPRGPLSALTGSLGDPGVVRREAAIAPEESPGREFDPYQEWGTQKVLEHFMIRPGEIEVATLGEAVEFLRETYRETGGRNVTFRIEGSPDAGFPVKAQWKNTSYRRLLDLLAGLGGYEIDVGDREVILRPRPPATGDADLAELSLPDLPKHLLAQTDPFGLTPVAELSPNGAAELLDLYGLGPDDPDGAIAIDPETGAWTLTGTGAQLARVETLSRHLGSTASAQVRVNQRIVLSEDGPVVDPQTFPDDAAFGEAFREILEGEVDMFGTPSVIVGAGQPAAVEVIREFIYPTAFDAAGSPSAFEMQPVGGQIPITLTVVGLDKVELSGHIQITSLVNQSIPELLGDNPFGAGVAKGVADGQLQILERGPGAFRSQVTEYSGALLDGNTAVLAAAEEGDTVVHQFIGARRILPDGSPLLP